MGTPGRQNTSAVAAPPAGVSQITCAIPFGPVGPGTLFATPPTPPAIMSPRVVIGLLSAFWKTNWVVATVVLLVARGCVIAVASKVSTLVPVLVGVMVIPAAFTVLVVRLKPACEV